MRLAFKLKAPPRMAPVDYPNIRIGALRLFAREHCNGKPTGGWVIASWHHQESITWRWLFTWSPHLGLPRFIASSARYGSAEIRLPIMGCFYVSWQPAMWRQSA